MKARRLRTRAWGPALIALALTAGALALGQPPAFADAPVTVTSSGPSRVVTGTDEPTGRILATFVIDDASRTATGATICRTLGDSKRTGCRYERFDGQVSETDPYDDYDTAFDSDFEDEYTRWDIVGEPGHWTNSYPIGFDGITREQCLTAAWEPKADFSAVIQVKNDAGVELAHGSWDYSVLCTGIEGGSTGPERTHVSASHTTQSKPFRFYVVDTRHVLDSYRICVYWSLTGKYSKCDYERLTQADRTDSGWTVGYHLTIPAQGSYGCAYVGRKWPQNGFRLQFYDSSMDQQLSLFRGTRLDC